MSSPAVWWNHKIKDAFSDKTITLGRRSMSAHIFLFGSATREMRRYKTLNVSGWTRGVPIKRCKCHETVKHLLLRHSLDVHRIKTIKRSHIRTYEY